MNVNIGLDIFPNPATSLIQLQLPKGIEGNVVIEIAEMSGRINRRISMQLNGNSTSTSIDVSTLPSGMYILQTMTTNGPLTKKFIKQ